LAEYKNSVVEKEKAYLESIIVSEDTDIIEEDNISYWFNRCKGWQLEGDDAAIETEGLRRLKEIWPMLYNKAHECIKLLVGDNILVHFTKGWEVCIVTEISKNSFWVKSRYDKNEHLLSWKKNRWFLVGRDKGLLKKHVLKKIGLKVGISLRSEGEMIKERSTPVILAIGEQMRGDKLGEGIEGLPPIRD